MFVHTHYLERRTLQAPLLPSDLSTTFLPPSPPSQRPDLDQDKPNAKAEPWSDAYYSYGARQTVYRMFHDTPGMNKQSTLVK